MTARLPAEPSPAIADTHSDQRGGPSIHRYFFALPAIIVAFVLVAGTAPVEARSRMALGVWMPSGNRDPQVYIDFGESLATTADLKRNAPAIWNASSQWGREDTKRFPLLMAQAALANKAVLMVTWAPVKPPFQTETGRFSRFKRIAKGKHDRYIRNWAKQAKKAGGPVFLRFAHEINVRYFPWTEHWGNFYDPRTGERSKPNDNSPYWFKKAWKRIYRIFKRVGATNVKFLWTVAKERCPGGCNPYRPWFPGNKFVHYIGFSNFNWGTHFDRTPSTFVQGVKHPMKKLTFTKKPIIIAELATTDEVNDGIGKPEWIKEGYPAVYKKYPRIKGVVYQNVDLAHLGHPDWSLYSPEEALDAYRSVAQQWRFRGRINKKGQVR